MRTDRAIFSSALALALTLPLAAADVPPTDPAALEFFEKKVRPVLAEHCYQCHSAQAKSPRGGLRADSRAALLIRAFNADVPCDQFVIEHVAGDLLDRPRLHPTGGFNESVLGTGFRFLGEEVHSPVDIRQDQADRFDNRSPRS